MSGSAFIAVDWGTTNRRAWRVEGGAVAARHADGKGILSVGAGGFAAATDEIRAALGALPMLLAGMVGSNRGWVDAGYVETPATLDALAAGLARPADGVAIAPGVKTLANGRADVMRGEEVQLLGAVAAGLAPADALLCQPGTHCKWARMEGGAIAGFVTAMTGELFAILKAHALIGGEMTGEVADDADFARGVADSANGDLIARLFGVRPAALLGQRAPGAAASYVSGLLIGADCRAQVRNGARVHLVSDPRLGALYASAIRAVGGEAVPVETEAAFLAGITRLWELAR